MFTLMTKTPKKDTAFSRFFREASSRDKKKVFATVLRKATEDQRKVLAKEYSTKAS